MPQRECSVSLILDVHRDSLQYLEELSDAKIASFTTHIHDQVLRSPEAHMRFEELMSLKPIEIDDETKLPDPGHIETHIFELLRCFRKVTLADLDLGTSDERAFPKADLVNESANYGENSNLTCMHIVWSEELQRYIVVYNRDLATVVPGTSPTQDIVLTPPGFEDVGAPKAKCAIRILLDMGRVIP